MATPQQVLNTLLAATLKAANLTNNNLVKLTGGALSVKWGEINRIQRGINCITRQYNLQDYSSPQFTTAYDCLLNFVGIDTGGSINPNAQVPNISITTINPIGYLSPMDIPWENFSPTDGIDGIGGRSVYYDVRLAGINPFLQDAVTTLLQINKDYTLIPSGGFVLLNSGNVPYIYQGEYLRATGYDLQGNVPVPVGTRIPKIFTDASSTPLDLTYLNTTYPYPTYIEGDLILVPNADLQYQRLSNDNPSDFSEEPLAFAQ